jgi:peptidoglycan/LPS O-acetylase OafA/YrhL
LPLYKSSGLGLVFANGTFAVDVFIILSGFVITLMINNKSEPITLYLTRRCLRLFTVYSVLMVNMSIEFLEALPWEHPKTLGRIRLFEAANTNLVEHTIAHALLAHGLVPSSLLPYTDYTLMGQAWSLTLELQFYFIAPALFLILRKNTYVFLTLTVFLLYVEPKFSGFFGHKSFIFGNISLFLLGIVSCELYLKRSKGIISEGKYIVLFLGCVCAVILYKTYRISVIHMIPVLIWCVALFSETMTKQISLFIFFKRFTNTKPVLWLGKVSYSLYCSHMIFLYGTGYLLIVVLDVEAQPIYIAIMLILPLILTLIFSTLTFRYIEKPFIIFGKNYRVNKGQSPEPVKVTTK